MWPFETQKSPAAASEIDPEVGPETEPWIGPDERFIDSTSLVVILLGVVVFGVGLALDLATPKYPEISTIFDACTDRASNVCAEALREFDRKSHVASELSWPTFFSGVLQVLGLTAVAAVFISSTVDRRTRTYFFEELARKTEVLGSNVLLGMFESRHHPKLFSLVKRHIFEKNIVRKNIDINYTIRDFDCDLVGTRLEGQKFVCVDVILSTVTENINVADSTSNGKITVPVKIGLPNPMLDELKPFVRINGFRIGDRVVAEEKIQLINNHLQDALQDDSATDAAVSVDEYDLQAGEMLTVSGSYTMVKEAQDTEVFRSIEIAENIHLTVVDKSSHNLRVRARSLAHAKLHGQPSPSAQQWKLDDLSLPLQGIMVWWKTAPRGPSPLACDVGATEEGNEVQTT